MPDEPREVDPVQIALRDGRRVTVRPVREGDAEKLQDAIRALSTESRYARFFSPVRELPPTLLERATHPEAGRELQLVVVLEEGADIRIIAGARYVALPRDGDCEFAVAVVDDWHGHGLARRLLEMLMQYARVSGFARMEGYVLATNARMLSLAKRLGFAESGSSEGPTVRTVRRDLRTIGS
jgi:RimJ/RimL family protein N-acetyltransferase